VAIRPLAAGGGDALVTPTLILAIAGGVLIAAGVYLLLERSLMRILAGVMLAGNGVNLLFLVSAGPAGLAPIVGEPEGDIADPLPQAMVLTAIVITLALTAFVLAMAYRSWQLHGHDEVQDDLEDRRIVRLAAKNAPSFNDLDSQEDSGSIDDHAAEARDETERGDA
jgi:multicomponent Na+:H+ antiporter subunit C